MIQPRLSVSHVWLTTHRLTELSHRLTELSR